MATTKINWYYGPWRWVSGLEPYWSPPSACNGLDLRTLPAQAISGGIPGMGIFWGNVNKSDVGSNYDLLGSDDLSSVKSSKKLIDTLSSKKYRPAGDNLLQLIVDMLTNGSDPLGYDAPKPLMPGNDCSLILSCGQTWREKFSLGVHSHTNRVLDVLRNDLSAVFDGVQAGIVRPKHHQRYLDSLCCQFKTDDWQQFIPRHLRQHIAGRIPHETTFSESFNKSDSTTLGPDLTWTETSGDLEVSSNACRSTTNDGVLGEARADHDVSSSDHYATVSVGSGSTSLTNCNMRVVARFNSSARTHYGATLGSDGGGNSQRATYKRITGTFTQLTQQSGYTWSANDILKIKCNGSTISQEVNGTQVATSTDTAITGNTRGGVTVTRASGGAMSVDSYYIADITTTITPTGGANAGGSGTNSSTYNISVSGGVNAGGIGYQTYNETASGGVNIAGNGTFNATYNISVSGGVNADGVGYQTYNETPTGGVNADGIGYQTYNETASNGANTNGNNNGQTTYNISVSGGVNADGVGYQTYNETVTSGINAAGSGTNGATYTITVNGGANTDGNNNGQCNYNLSVSGGVLAAGHADEFMSSGSGNTYDEFGTGGPVVGGNVAAVVNYNLSVSGGENGNGQGILSDTPYISGGSLSAGNATTQINYNTSTTGGATAAGNATTQINYNLSVSGGSNGGGSGIVQTNYNLSVSGGVLNNGNTAPSLNITQSVVGGITINGAANSYVTYVCVIAGGGQLSGSNTNYAQFVISVAGSSVANGGGSVSCIYFFDITGGAICDGSAPPLDHEPVVFDETARGGIHVGGTARFAQFSAKRLLIPINGIYTSQQRAIVGYVLDRQLYFELEDHELVTINELHHSSVSLSKVQDMEDQLARIESMPLIDQTVPTTKTVRLN